VRSTTRWLRAGSWKTTAITMKATVTLERDGSRPAGISVRATELAA
jgi:hypothetical protein